MIVTEEKSVSTVSIDRRIAAARAALDSARGKLATARQYVREAKAALETAEREENYFMLEALRRELEARIEDAAIVQELDEVETAEERLQDLLAEQRRESLEEYRVHADRLLRAAEELDAAAKAEHAFRQSRHGGLRTEDFLPWVTAVSTSVLPQWLAHARKRFADVFRNST